MGQLSPLASWWTEVQTPDPSTVVLISDQPRPGVFDFFEYFNIVDPVAAEGPDGATKPVGSGPFMLTDYAQGDHITFKKNANYRQSGKPSLDGFVVTLFRDQQAMVAQLEGGALDVPSTPDAARLKSDPKYQFVVDPASAYTAWCRRTPNCRRPTTNWCHAEGPALAAHFTGQRSGQTECVSAKPRYSEGAYPAGGPSVRWAATNHSGAGCGRLAQHHRQSGALERAGHRLHAPRIAGISAGLARVNTVRPATRSSTRSPRAWCNPALARCSLAACAARQWQALPRTPRPPAAH
jgi:extracellular solute-binding protein (family 5)